MLNFLTIFENNPATMWIIIAALLAIGLALIIIEIVFIPGTTVVGILGFVFAITGIVISYKHFGSDIGFYILIGTLVISASALYYSFRSGAWTRFSLKSSSQGKVNEGLTASINIGDEGTALSTLRPVGKAEFGKSQFEVKTLGSYVDTGSRVRIKTIISNQIIVEPIN
jgi:membrane-bound ClpP family serine protease